MQNVMMSNIKKLLFVFLIIFLLTGCEAVYNIEINDNNYVKDELIVFDSEDAIVTGLNKKYKDLFDGIFNTLNLPIDDTDTGFTERSTKLPGHEYYEKEIYSEGNNYGIRYYYHYLNNTYGKSPIFIPFYHYSIDINGTGAILDSGEAAKCYIYEKEPLLDKLTINVKTNYKVVNNNADSVNNNIYTWVLTRDNYKSKNIHIEIDKSVKLVNKEDSDRSDLITNIILIGVGIVLFASIIVTIIKVKKSNK